MVTLSLVWKDVAAAQRLLWLVIPLATVQLAVMALVPEIYPLAAITFAALVAFGSIAIEEAQRTELLWNSLPVSRGEFVAARYLTTLVGMLAGLVFAWTLAQAVTWFTSSGADGSNSLLGLSAHAVFFGFLAFSAAVYLPLYFRFGAGRALLFFLAISVLAVAVVSALISAILAAKGYPSPVSDPEAWGAAAPALMREVAGWVEPRSGLLLGGFVGSAVLAMGISLLISRKLYEARDL
jgi:ABC-type transport system involved in multi-copper enzyme maturation permease subunit